MRAIVYTETGDPSVLQLVERPVTEPGPDEVRVRIVVSGVNPTDWKSRRGAASVQALPFDEVVPGQDGAGIVEAIGSDVHHVAVGDRVWLAMAAYQRSNSGSSQEQAVIPAERVFALPASASFDQGASLGVPAVTAYRALTVAEDGPDELHPTALNGKVVLVAGGAGAVGHAAIQLARWAGATVITTVSGPAKAALATAAGAHHVLTYTDADIVEQIRTIAPEGVDQIVEVAPSQNADLNLAVIRNRGSISIYANNSPELTLDVRRHITLNVRYQFVLLYTVGIDVIRAAGAAINIALEDGALGVGEETGLPLHRFSLEQTADAHALVESGAVGKVLIDVTAA
ncbi:NADPH:quinone reductase [Salinibacterium sp. SWN139]|uniref:NADPH:quinone reductase n=1 Tax=Salinibacterium sp. SWN139 TaxID=2792055 RepID=UPI0018CD0E30|nr:NADPH:quinone reductase [Salinibacterium sp. SWN139]MBH0054993.1 NADPH:quinone reductase [Salinibacterium sp. SWN139]